MSRWYRSPQHTIRPTTFCAITNNWTGGAASSHTSHTRPSPLEAYTTIAYAATCVHKIYFKKDTSSILSQCRNTPVNIGYFLFLIFKNSHTVLGFLSNCCIKYITYKRNVLPIQGGPKSKPSNFVTKLTDFQKSFIGSQQ